MSDAGFLFPQTDPGALPGWLAGCYERNGSLQNDNRQAKDIYSFGLPWIEG
jgi:hypothetical protein